MLKHLGFHNFKSWPSANIDFGKITGIFGTNSSGKTSLLQFLLLLKQTKDATDRSMSLDLNGPLVNLGVYRDIAYRHDETKPLKWNLELSLDREITIADPSAGRSAVIARSSTLRVSAQVLARDKQPLSSELEYALGNTTFSLKRRGESFTDFDLTSSGSPFRFIRSQGRAWPLPRPAKSYAFPDQARLYFQNASFLSDIEAAYEAQLDGIFYLGPLREFPQRDYLWARSRPQDVGRKGERAVEAILAATTEGERRNVKHRSPTKPFQEMIAYWLREMGLIHDFRVEEIGKNSNRWQAKVVVRKGGTEALLTDVGFGVSQVLPVVTLLQYVPPKSTVILEQPEIHLHPLAQAALADVIINAAVHRNVQVILESHSEHLLLRLQRRMAEGELDSDDVKLYFCDAPRGDSQLEALKLDLFGQIENWPSQFMGDAFGETLAAERARIATLKAQRNA